MAESADDRDRRDERTVEIVYALVLGVGTFLGLLVAGWGIDRAFRGTLGASLAPFASALLVTAVLVGLGVMVRQLLRARRRGL